MAYWTYCCANALEASRNHQCKQSYPTPPHRSSSEDRKSAYFQTFSLLDSEFEQKHILESTFKDQQQWGESTLTTFGVVLQCNGEICITAELFIEILH